MTKNPLFPTSIELFRLVRRIADDIPSDEKWSDADIGRVVGLESARTSRWKYGLIALNDVARLMALSRTFSVDLQVLSHVAAGSLSCDEALEILSRDKDFVKFLGEQIMVPQDDRALTLLSSGGSEARIVRASISHTDRVFRKSGGLGQISRSERERIVLFADDDPGAIDIFTNLTGKGTGITAAVARSLPDLLIEAGARRPRLIIVDLYLSGGDVFQAIRSLRALEATSAAEIVAISRVVSPEVVRRAVGSGARSVMEKPLKVRALAHLLRELR